MMIETWREGLVVRCRLLDHGRPLPLPWLVDCFTHAGARRKAKRHMRRLAAAQNPRQLVVSPSNHEKEGRA